MNWFQDLFFFTSTPGKAHVVCKGNGLQFRITTLFPFSGQIFARDRKSSPQFVLPLTFVSFVSIFSEQRAETQYHMQIVVVFQQKNNTSTVQSFIAQCLHQKIHYQKQQIPKRIEEALEELHLIPAKLQQKAPIPECMMRIVTEQEHGHGDDGTEVDTVSLGQAMRIEWSLIPESDAYGFHVRNCTVRDMLSDEEYQVIDERGCSTDINIFSHPHYDTYHDTARVHWHAFKVPDSSQLSIKCFMEICTDIPDMKSGLSNCDSIPSPPFCPDLVTSSTNALIFDEVIRKRRDHALSQQHVHADICFGDSKDKYCNSTIYQADRKQHISLINGMNLSQ
ncbi:unnamed protein product [Thelazia callipaeda]|uniref:ZP domain-containing protein n=1 Tax=Thelazia callipaeda TaxID=103827 RepID=A0A3P7N552_THECL|nr:unnamed protein product [Thelazia callipaeda]